METIVIIAVWLFALTHIDTLVVLIAFCADSGYHVYEVLLGHYIGFSIGLIAAVGGTLLAAELFHSWSFLLGGLPVLIGVWSLLRRYPSTHVADIEAIPDQSGRVGVVTTAGIGLSGENIAVFIPFFTRLSTTELLLVVLAYVVAAGLVFLLAYFIAQIFGKVAIPPRLDRWLVPSILILVGLAILGSGIFIS